MNLSKSYIVYILLSFAACLLIGCQPPEQDVYAPVIHTPQQISHEFLGHSLQHRPIELWTLGTGPEKVLIIATIHGNEDAGTPLVYELIETLKFKQSILKAYTVFIVPNANPDGYFLRTRSNAAGVDLNRNFPANNRINNHINGDHPLTEPESKLLHNLILEKQPDRIVSIHQPLNCLDYDGPGEDIARTMSYYCPLPVKKLGSRPGSLGSFVGVERRTPIITMELSADDSDLSAQQLWRKYGISLMAAITYPKPPY